MRSHSIPFPPFLHVLQQNIWMDGWSFGEVTTVHRQGLQKCTNLGHLKAMQGAGCQKLREAAESLP